MIALQGTPIHTAADREKLTNELKNIFGQYAADPTMDPAMSMSRLKAAAETMGVSSAQFEYITNQVEALNKKGNMTEQAYTEFLTHIMASLQIRTGAQYNSKCDRIAKATRNFIAASFAVGVAGLVAGIVIDETGGNGGTAVGSGFALSAALIAISISLDWAAQQCCN